MRGIKNIIFVRYVSKAPHPSFTPVQKKNPLIFLFQWKTGKERLVSILNCYSFSSLLSTIAGLIYQLPSARESYFADDKVEWLVWNWLPFFWGVPASHGVVSWASCSVQEAVAPEGRQETGKDAAEPFNISGFASKENLKRAVKTDLVNIWSHGWTDRCFHTET